MRILRREFADRTTSGCAGVLAEFESKSTGGQRWGGLVAQSAQGLRNLPYALGQTRQESIWSTVRRLSKVRHDSGRCQPESSNGSFLSGVRRSGRDSCSARFQPPLPLLRFVPIARVPPPAPPAPEGDWDSNTAPRAPRTARHHIAAANSG